MELDADACYRALTARDPRFDGMFFVGVRTTGIYCRPVCRARTPGRDRCVFFRRPAEAEREGFRACFLCRPELAPGTGPEGALPRLVEAAVRRIEEGALDEGSVDDLAHALGVTGRHLRRALSTELGVTPVAIAQSRRLALAKQLLHDTRLPLTEVAFASGFGSVRRFNAIFRARFGNPPSALRGGRAAERPGDAIALRLDYRPPFAWDSMLSFLGARAIPGVEAVEGGVYRRTVRLGGAVGWVAVTGEPNRPALRASVSLSLAGVLVPLVARLRALFDLDAHPSAIAAHLAHDPLLAPLVERCPGLRVPGAFDGFETAVRAVLGQQVSVRAATTLSGRLALALGDPIEAPHGLTRLFPRPDTLVREEQLAAIGLPGARARTILSLSRAAAAGDLRLERHGDPVVTIERLLALPGIGDWTAQYVAMRVLGSPDAFPAGDLVLRKALGGVSTREALERAESFRPFRAYAAMHLWASLSQGTTS
ncbi:DNA-3-methyladenine glycosylase 2 [Polyangium aurulentum]|uniref:DNA-3-methyladenine glycosylase 2 n=1 Tax=Polyangium aurulentum TaxID=2567896 RepID=UPI0010AE1612|nr:DNA-3-methyladenine glycosylase 2 [Polyangium aurulentum]